MGISTQTWDILLNMGKQFTWKNKNVGHGLEFYTDEFFKKKNRVFTTDFELYSKIVY